MQGDIMQPYELKNIKKNSTGISYGSHEKLIFHIEDKKTRDKHTRCERRFILARKGQNRHPLRPHQVSKKEFGFFVIF
jgi:hypothetical protein